MWYSEDEEDTVIFHDSSRYFLPRVTCQTNLNQNSSLCRCTQTEKWNFTARYAKRMQFRFARRANFEFLFMWPRSMEIRSSRKYVSWVRFRVTLGARSAKNEILSLVARESAFPCRESLVVDLNRLFPRVCREQPNRVILLLPRWYTHRAGHTKPRTDKFTRYSIGWSSLLWP